MIKAKLEITESDYCITLSKDTFNLSHIHQLIRHINAEKPTCTKQRLADDADLNCTITDYFEMNFDSLADK